MLFDKKIQFSPYYKTITVRNEYGDVLNKVSFTGKQEDKILEALARLSFRNGWVLRFGIVGSTFFKRIKE
jgi:hypothetical protein